MTKTMTPDEMFDTDDWTPNQWDGWDYSTKNPNLLQVAVRVTREDGQWTVYRFEGDRYAILDWSVRVDSAAPWSVLYAVVAEALAQ